MLKDLATNSSHIFQITESRDTALEFLNEASMPVDVLALAAYLRAQIHDCSKD
jgi:hypothetical protein